MWAVLLLSLVSINSHADENRCMQEIQKNTGEERIIDSKPLNVRVPSGEIPYSPEKVGILANGDQYVVLDTVSYDPYFRRPKAKSPRKPLMYRLIAPLKNEKEIDDTKIGWIEEDFDAYGWTTKSIGQMRVPCQKIKDQQDIYCKKIKEADIKAPLPSSCESNKAEAKDKPKKESGRQ